MEEKELLRQLNNLKEISPRADWKEENRGILLNQIYGEKAREAGKPFGFSLIFNYMRSVSQPVMVMILLLAVVFGGGVFSMKAAENTKPGDSLYIAKIISEKTQRALTFDEKEKVQLGIKFASNRIKEIDQVMKEPDDKKEEKVEKLVEDFKKEISFVKVKLAEMNVSKKKTMIAEEVKKEGVNEEAEAEESSQVFSANFTKEEKGIQISENEPAYSGIRQLAEADSAGEPVPVDESGAANPASDEPGATKKEIASSSETVKEVKEDTHSILKKAEDLIEKEEYEETLNILGDVDGMIDKVINKDQGEVLGVEEAATEDVNGEENDTGNNNASSTEK